MRESLPHSRRESSAPPSHRPGQLRSELLKALSLALPYHQNVNTKVAKGAGLASIPRHVRSKLGQPECPVPFWCRRPRTAPMPMPEATMHEYGEEPVGSH